MKDCPECRHFGTNYYNCDDPPQHEDWCSHFARDLEHRKMGRANAAALLRLEAFRAILSEIRAECSRLEEFLTPDCIHPGTHRHWNTWEWDNGYGIQKMLKRWYCDICSHEEKTFDAA